MAQPNAWFRSSLSSSDTYVRSRNKLRSVCLESFTHFLFTLIENAKLYKLDPYEYLRCIFDQAPFCESEKDFEKLLPWNIKITEFNEEGTWKTDA
ncbi:transposase domain-containing protein [uncultured Treponema sp.]|uniref:transposase domain-containing protein n=1 Tax=uncultured Treponema sp. TaxID=162155 RepID=UPI002595CAEC|nr:transposase domain-containing protein [uncultured Treponema sp.]